jgi:hypothetical protein
MCDDCPEYFVAAPTYFGSFLSWITGSVLFPDYVWFIIGQLIYLIVLWLLMLSFYLFIEIIISIYQKLK